MDVAYSPHRQAGGTMHLPSPTHPHTYRIESFSSIQKKLRRSLSRSPSKPSRFRLRNSDAPGSPTPISPLALSRAFSPRPQANDAGPMATVSTESPQTQTPSTTKKKLTLRRTAPFRTSPRRRTKSKSPRRILTDSTDHGNATPVNMGRTSGEQNAVMRGVGTENFDIDDMDDLQTEQKPATRFNINDQPIEFKYARSRPDTNAPGANCLMPTKSSPLKRSDGIMNLDSTNMGSPVAKRRSLHGASCFGADFDVFEHGPAPRQVVDEVPRSHDVDSGHVFSFSSPIAKTHSPLRRTSSLRKSTLSQRHGANVVRSKPTFDGEFAIPGAAASKTRNRMSLDSSLALSSGTTQSPFRKSTNFDPIRGTPNQSFPRGVVGGTQPHPLSHALTPSSSMSSLVGISPSHVAHAMPPPGPRRPGFSRSLPIGATRPQESGDGSFATPAAYKMARPNPDAFLSTGLLSKKNRNVDEMLSGAAGGYVMPDTPSKRYSFPPVTSSPSVERTARTRVLDLGKMPQRPEFGTPSTPFSFHAPSKSLGSCGNGVSIFGSFGNSGLQRRSSFASIDGDDCSHSPSGNHMTDSQSSADDMPPTPTKQHDGSGRRSKENSLRRKTFRQRSSLGADTFTAPNDATTPDIDTLGTMTTPQVSFGSSSPHTPNESFMPPDASGLSISGQRRDSLPYNAGTNGFSFPPATPMTPRVESDFFTNGHRVGPIIGLTKNDVDTSMTQRFHSVSVIGNGEFSTVYRAEKSEGLPFASPRATQVWAVKKTKKPYTGPGDREKKLREVHILAALRGHDHVLALADHWEFKDHLYIQTEFCEDGTLTKFLAESGFKGRIDDFRIWKILLELSSGIQHIHDNSYIHLDLKPANVFIDFHGVLKIGDFGLATTWPAGRHIEAEGDRHYLAPEVMRGRYDKPADVYALGLIMVEVGANIVVPENGESWVKLRAGNFEDLPSLTWSSESSLNRDAHGDPIDEDDGFNGSTETICLSESSLDSFGSMCMPFLPPQLDKAPEFMINRLHPDSMDQLAQWMMNPDPDLRPTIDQVHSANGCQWVEQRARSGATIYEGNFGPIQETIHHDSEDMMDTS